MTSSNETISALLAICAGNSPVTGEFPSQRLVTPSIYVFFDLRLNERLSKNRDAWDSRGHRAHYDLNVMGREHAGALKLKIGHDAKFIVIGGTMDCDNDNLPCRMWWQSWLNHYIDVIMTTMASQITSLTVVYSTVYSDADQRKHQSSASLAFVWGIHRDRWIPRTKGQLRGQCFHLMTSSFYNPRLHCCAELRRGM